MTTCMTPKLKGFAQTPGGKRPKTLYKPAEVSAHDQHVSAVLSDAKHPIDLLRHRVVTSDRFASFRSEIDFAAYPIETVRRPQCAQFHGGQAILAYQIHDGQCVPRV